MLASCPQTGVPASALAPVLNIHFVMAQQSQNSFPGQIFSENQTRRGLQRF